MRKLVVVVAVLVVAVAVVLFSISDSAAGRVPGDVRLVDVTLRIGHGPLGNDHVVTSTHVFTAAATVQELITSVDGLATVPKGSIWKCPAAFAEATRRQLILSFKTGPARPAIVRVEVYVSPGREGDSGWTPCDGIEFSIGVRRQIALTSHTCVRHVGRLIGADIS